MSASPNVIEIVSLAEYARHQAETYHNENDQAAIAFRHIANCIATALESADASGYARGRAEAVEECARVADSVAQRMRDLFDRGKGAHGMPGYVRDATWHSWSGKLSGAQDIAASIRALNKEPSHEG